MTAKDLESKLMTAISTATSALTPKPAVCGSWQPALSGLVRWVEDVSSPAAISVAVGTAQNTTYTTATVSFSVNVTLFVRYDMDPEGTALVSISDALEDLFRTWQSDTYQTAYTALDISTFSVGDVSVTGGNSPAVNLDKGYVSVTWPITISGCFINPQN